MKESIITLLTILFSMNLNGQYLQAVTCESAKKIGKNRGYDIFCTNHTRHNYVVEIDPHYLLNLRTEGPKSRTLSPGKSKVMSLRPNDENGRYALNFRFKYWVGCKKANHDKDAFYLLPVKSNNYTAFRELYDINERYGNIKKEDEDFYAVTFSVSEGDTIYAARSGIVSNVTQNISTSGDNLSFAREVNKMSIQHGDCTYAVYKIFKEDSALVKEGDKVLAGQPLALAGGREFSSGEHLRFYVYKYNPGNRKKDGKTVRSGQLESKYYYTTFPVDFLVNGERTKLQPGQEYKSAHPHEMIMKEMGRREKKKYKKKHGL